MKPAQRLRALNQLLESRGWADLEEVMKAEITTAAMAIASNPNMTLDEINFRRGAIWAAKQLLQMPHSLKARVEAEVALHKDDPGTPKH